MFSGIIFPPRDKKDARKRLAAAASRCEGVYNRAVEPLSLIHICIQEFEITP